MAAAAVGLLVACQSDTMTPIGDAPLAQLSDGANAGNPDFFFLPPLLKNPINHPQYEPKAFNAHVSPVVEICELTLQANNTIGCGTVIKRFESGEVNVAEQFYKVNWNTDESNLNVSKNYRIRVIVGTTELGFADVDPVTSAKDLKSVNTGEFIGLVDGRTLPIKFRIENAALCGGVDPCNSTTIDLADGGTVILEQTGDRVDIPAQASGRVITVTIQFCDGVDVDAPRFGNCVSVTADPPLGDLRLQPAATVSICSAEVDPALAALTHDQHHLVTLYRQDGEDIFALPHSHDFCETVIGRTSPAGFLGRLAHAVGRLFAPQTLHASVALDVGDAGDTQFFSDFQLVLPTKIEATNPAPRTGTPGGPANDPPAVRAYDRNGDPVVGATVRFSVTGGDGSIAAPSCSSSGGSLLCQTAITGDDGIARAGVATWTLGNPGTNTVHAFGFGIAAGEDGPYMPDNIDEDGQPVPPEDQETVTVGSVPVVFTANATPPNEFEIETILTDLQYPKALWITEGAAYLTETANHNTGFGGRDRLLRQGLDGQELEVLIDNPVNSDALVVTDDGSIYLASYRPTIPGDNGEVSVARFDADLGWQETPLVTIGIAANDMFLGRNQDIYIIGSSTSPDASSLYLLEAPDYFATVFRSGLGTAWSLTQVGAVTYYSLHAGAEVRRFSGEIDQSVFSGRSVLSLSTDGTWLYYGEFGGRIGRWNLLTGADETLASGLQQINAVRYDAATSRLYFLEAGSEAAQYKDGALKSILIPQPIP
jgi:hypothetical protein